ncbi:MAG: glycosyltransferase [Kiritimatiellia bacterium]
MNLPAISVVTVCRNSAKELPAAAASVLGALGAGDEWVVQDGASTDGSAEFLRGLGDPRLRLETRPDGGIYDALNRAAARAKGDFLLFLGADDRLRIRLDEARSFLKDARTVYYGDVWRTATGDRYAGAFDGAKLARTNICQQAVFYPRAAFEKRTFDVRYAQQADWAFNMDCFADSSLKFEYLPLLVADYAQGGASSTRMDEVFQREYRRLLKKYFPFRQRWRPALASALSDVFRALPGVPAPRQTPARAK